MKFYARTYPNNNVIRYEGKIYVAVAEEDDILSLFHHIHHEESEDGNEPEHKVHHCGGKHVEVDPTVDYNIEHCSHGKHSIDKETAVGHATDEDIGPAEILVEFTEECSDGGWHIESGEIVEEEKEEIG